MVHHDKGKMTLESSKSFHSEKALFYYKEQRTYIHTRCACIMCRKNEAVVGMDSLKGCLADIRFAFFSLSTILVHTASCLHLICMVVGQGLAVLKMLLYRWKFSFGNHKLRLLTEFQAPSWVVYHPQRHSRPCCHGEKRRKESLPHYCYASCASGCILLFSERAKASDKADSWLLVWEETPAGLMKGFH